MIAEGRDRDAVRQYICSRKEMLKTEGATSIRQTPRARSTWQYLGKSV